MKDPAEPTAALRSIPIEECGEPLVNYLEACPNLMQDRPRFHYRRESVAREGFVTRLCAANASLMKKGYRLLILEGWRAPHIQRRMFQAVQKDIRERFPDLQGEAFTALVEQFSAPMDLEVPPPHTTGGAADLWLGDLSGQPMDLIAPFAWTDHEAFAFDANGLSDEARKHRDLLAEALLAQDVTNYPSEYWHWSYGDQGWAYRGDKAQAIYAAIQPTDWTAAPEDDIDAPLAFIEED